MIEKREVGTDDWMPASRGQLVKCPMANITHLKEDHEYEFRVIAVNPAGQSAPCVIERPITVSAGVGEEGQTDRRTDIPNRVSLRDPSRSVQGRREKERGTDGQTVRTVCH